MNLISCNYNCKYQKEGYCYLTDISKAKPCGNENCIYFDKIEEEFPAMLSDDSELP